MKHRKVTDIGDVKEIEISASWREVGKGFTRGPNVNKTSETQAQRNLRNTIKHFTAILNANFFVKDLFITLTHAKKISEEEAIKKCEKFIRDVRKVRRIRHMREMKYVVRDELVDIDEKKRWHHHVVMTKIDLETVFDIWGDNGIVINSSLRGGRFTGLAHYLLKDAVGEHKKKWRQSKGLIMPKPRYEPLQKGDLTDAPIRTPRGYRKVYSYIAYYEETGLYKYAKFIKNGGIDLAMGERDVFEVRKDE